MDNTVKSVKIEPKAAKNTSEAVKENGAKSDNKQLSIKDKYFNTKTIACSLLGLAVLGTATVLGIKKWHGSKLKNDVQVPDTKNLKADIYNIKERIVSIKKLIRDNYTEQRSHLYNELSTADEYGIKIRFNSMADLKSQMNTLQNTHGDSLANADKIISANRRKIEEMTSNLSKDAEWNEINSLREQCRKIIETSGDNEQKRIAAEKIPLLNELIYAKVYPESVEKGNLYGIENSQLLSIARKDFATLDDFMKEFDALKKPTSSFDYDISEKKISHSGILCEKDIFPKEYDIIESNLRIKKVYEEKLAEYKKIYDKAIDGLKRLAGEYRNSSEVKELRNLIKQLRVKEEMLAKMQ